MFILHGRLLIAGLLPIYSSGRLGVRSERLTSYKASLLNRDVPVTKVGWMDEGTS